MRSTTAGQAGSNYPQRNSSRSRRPIKKSGQDRNRNRGSVKAVGSSCHYVAGELAIAFEPSINSTCFSASGVDLNQWS